MATAMKRMESWAESDDSDAEAPGKDMHKSASGLNWADSSDDER
jgi:hypothetical protein